MRGTAIGWVVGALVAGAVACADDGGDAADDAGTQGQPTAGDDDDDDDDDDTTTGDDDDDATGTGEPTLAPMWLGVGNWGYRSQTTDGVEWTTQQNPSTGNDHSPDLLRGVGYGNGWFVAVGGDANSMVMRSADGETWEEDLHPTGTQWVGDTAYGDGRWVAVGGVGRVMHSDDDGATWTDNEETLPAAGRAAAWGDGNFVAVGDGGMIAVSADGESWSDHTQKGSVRLGEAVYGHGTWLVIGQSWNGTDFDTNCFVSGDAAQWDPCPFTSGRYDGAVFSDDLLIVAVETGYEWSDDGETFTHADADIPGTSFFAEGQWVGAQNDRRYQGATLDAMEETVVKDRSFRDFTLGWVPVQ